MEQVRTENALVRIEAALARINDAAKPAGSPDAALAARHAALQRKVTAALADLDKLIAGVANG